MNSMSGTAVMNVTDVTEDFNKVSLADSDPAASVPQSSSAADIEKKFLPAPPTRRLSRNKSGPQGNRLMSSSGSSGAASAGVVAVGAGGPMRRAPPGRSKSHKIGRPTFDPKAPTIEPARGLNRSKSGRVKGAPGRTGSFNRRVPDRSASASSSLRNRRQMQQQQQAAEVSDDISVTDSVFTSASIQTLDSIAVRKKQIDHGSDVPILAGGMRGQRPRGGDGPAIEFDDTLHTVDSMHLNHRHVSDEYYDEDCDDLSVFSESFASTASCEVLSDFEEYEMDGAIAEDEDEATMKSEDEKME